MEQKDKQVLRDLAKQYADIASKPEMDERRKLWSDHFSLKKTRPPVLVGYGMHNVWCREVFGDDQMTCEDPFFRGHERMLRMHIFHDTIGDDCILEPWISQRAAIKGSWGELWGVKQGRHDSGTEGGAWKFDPPIKEWADMQKLRVTPHEIDEEATERNVSRLSDAIGDILTIDVPRGAVYSGFMGDISTDLARLRGLETIMMDMYDDPEELHKLLAFMRDAIVENNRIAEEAGDYSLTTQTNQAEAYANELEPLKPNSGPRKRKGLWGFCAAQEFTSVSPVHHNEFLIQYQLPIMEPFGLIHYGCCEDLTRKIDVLRQFKNLRSIGIAPRADLRKCAEQMKTDYAISWRPNPTDMVCAEWDEALIRKVVSEALEICQESCLHIFLKDIETVQGDPNRLIEWTRIVNECIDAR